MTDIGPGDWVECVDDSGPNNPYYIGPTLVKGALYQLEAIGLPYRHCGRDNCGDPRVRVFGRTFCPHRFRPIHRRSSFNCEELLKNIPADLKEPEPV